MLYSEKVMKMFRDSKHYGKIENADGLGKVGNPKCGDVMWIYIKVDNGIITDAKFETFGCVAAIATSSMAIEMVKGKPVDEALELTNKAVAEALKKGSNLPLKIISHVRSMPHERTGTPGKICHRNLSPIYRNESLFNFRFFICRITAYPFG